MGNQQGLGVCCSENAAPPVNMDMINPHHLDASILFQAAACGSLDDEQKTQEEAALERMNKNLMASCPSDGSVRTQLLMAARQDDSSSVLQHVADGAEVADLSETLRLAAQRGSASVVRELVAVGLSVNDCCPHSGFSPLHLASASGQLSVCELLLDALADLNKSVSGNTALSLAHKMGNVEVEEILERHAETMARQGDAAENALSHAAHVLPRVSPVLSEAILQALPAQSAFSTGQQSGNAPDTASL